MTNKNYKNVHDFFELLNINGIKYVVLRNYEEMHNDDFFTEGHEDIDLLVEDINSFIDCSYALPKMSPDDKVHLEIIVDGIKVPLDVRSVGDDYYDSKWEKEIINNRVLAPNGNWYVMDKENYYYSLAYHAILQKEKLSYDYLMRLNKMSISLEIDSSKEAEHIKNLNKWMKIKGYHYTKAKDSSVPLRKIYFGCHCFNRINMRGVMIDLKNHSIDVIAWVLKKIGLYDYVRTVKRRYK